MHWIPCSVVKCIPSERSGLHAAWGNVSRLDAVESMQHAAMDPLGHTAWNPRHSLSIHCSMLHGFHCIQPGYIAPRCMQSTAFTRDAFHNAAWNPVHSIMPHDIHCIQSGSIGPSCMHSSAFILDAFHTAAWNPVNSITLHGIHCIQSVSVTPSCMESTSFNRDTLHHSA